MDVQTAHENELESLRERALHSKRPTPLNSLKTETMNETVALAEDGEIYVPMEDGELLSQPAMMNKSKRRKKMERLLSRSFHQPSPEVERVKQKFSRDTIVTKQSSLKNKPIIPYDHILVDKPFETWSPQMIQYSKNLSKGSISSFNHFGSKEKPFERKVIRNIANALEEVSGAYPLKSSPLSHFKSLENPSFVKDPSMVMVDSALTKNSDLDGLVRDKSITGDKDPMVIPFSKEDTPSLNSQNYIPSSEKLGHVESVEEGEIVVKEQRKPVKEEVKKFVPNYMIELDDGNDSENNYEEAEYEEDVLKYRRLLLKPFNPLNADEPETSIPEPQQTKGSMNEVTVKILKQEIEKQATSLFLKQTEYDRLLKLIGKHALSSEETSREMKLDLHKIKELKDAIKVLETAYSIKVKTWTSLEKEKNLILERSIKLRKDIDLIQHSIDNKEKRLGEYKSSMIMVVDCKPLNEKPSENKGRSAIHNKLMEVKKTYIKLHSTLLKHRLHLLNKKNLMTKTHLQKIKNKKKSPISEKKKWDREERVDTQTLWNETFTGIHWEKNTKIKRTVTWMEKDNLLYPSLVKKIKSWFVFKYDVKENQEAYESPLECIAYYKYFLSSFMAKNSSKLYSSDDPNAILCRNEYGLSKKCKKVGCTYAHLNHLKQKNKVKKLLLLWKTLLESLDEELGRALLKASEEGLAAMNTNDNILLELQKMLKTVISHHSNDIDIGDILLSFTKDDWTLEQNDSNKDQDIQLLEEHTDKDILKRVKRKFQFITPEINQLYYNYLNLHTSQESLLLKQRYYEPQQCGDDHHVDDILELLKIKDNEASLTATIDKVLSHLALYLDKDNNDKKGQLAFLELYVLRFHVNPEEGNYDKIKLIFQKILKRKGFNAFDFINIYLTYEEFLVDHQQEKVHLFSEIFKNLLLYKPNQNELNEYSKLLWEWIRRMLLTFERLHDTEKINAIFNDLLFIGDIQDRLSSNRTSENGGLEFSKSISWNNLRWNELVQLLLYYLHFIFYKSILPCLEKDGYFFVHLPSSLFVDGPSSFVVENVSLVHWIKAIQHAQDETCDMHWLLMLTYTVVQLDLGLVQETPAVMMNHWELICLRLSYLNVESLDHPQILTNWRSRFTVDQNIILCLLLCSTGVFTEGFLKTWIKETLREATKEHLQDLNFIIEKVDRTKCLQWIENKLCS